MRNLVWKVVTSFSVMLDADDRKQYDLVGVCPSLGHGGHIGHPHVGRQLRGTVRVTCDETCSRADEEEGFT